MKWLAKTVSHLNCPTLKPKCAFLTQADIIQNQVSDIYLCQFSTLFDMNIWEWEEGKEEYIVHIKFFMYIRQLLYT